MQVRVADLTLDELRAMVAKGPPYARGLVKGLQQDARVGVRALYDVCMREKSSRLRERNRLSALLQFEAEAIANGFSRVAGVDEAGRGPLAGPIVAGAVVLNGSPPAGVNDSKQLTEAQREGLYDSIIEGQHWVGVGIVEPSVIDQHGIQSANYGVMLQAVNQLEPRPDFLLVDGFMIRGCALPQKKIIKGDRLSASIAAASIVAKVVRDRIMRALDRQYPGYGFAEHKGYATAEHLDALRRLGPCPAHRRSFSPVMGPAETGLLFEL